MCEESSSFLASSMGIHPITVLSELNIFSVKICTLLWNQTLCLVQIMYEGLFLVWLACMSTDFMSMLLRVQYHIFWFRFAFTVSDFKKVANGAKHFSHFKDFDAQLPQFSKEVCGQLICKMVRNPLLKKMFLLRYFWFLCFSLNAIFLVLATSCNLYVFQFSYLVYGRTEKSTWIFSQPM